MESPFTVWTTMTVVIGIVQLYHCVPKQGMLPALEICHLRPVRKGAHVDLVLPDSLEEW